MRTLYITDLDGTLLNNNGVVSDNTSKIINKVIEKGYLFSFATARSLLRAKQATNGINFNAPVIVHNGVFITEINNEIPTISNIFNNEENEKLKKIFEKLDIKPFVYSLIDNKEKISYNCDYSDEGTKNYLQVRKGDIRLNPLKDGNNIYCGDIYYYLCIGTYEELERIPKAIEDKERFNCIIQKEPNRPEYYCEIMPKQATKANAILNLKEFLHCDRIISFGDGINDIPMFEISDECYAVENADAKLKKIATGIIQSNQDDGVANWICTSLLK